LFAAGHNTGQYKVTTCVKLRFRGRIRVST